MTSTTLANLSRRGLAASCHTTASVHAVNREVIRWTPDQTSHGHSLPLRSVLELFGAMDEHQAVERMLGLLSSQIDADFALAIEYVLHGGVLKVRQEIPYALAPWSVHEMGRGLDDALTDPAHAHLVASARGFADDAMFGMRCEVEPLMHWRRQQAQGRARCERISLIYTLAQNTVWAMHFFPHGLEAQPQPGTLMTLLSCGGLVREAHRIASPAASVSGERVDSAEVRLSVRAASLSGRERQVCARIADGQSAATIAAELGVSASTVTTLRKRAYAKLGIHDRLDLRQLAA